MEIADLVASLFIFLESHLEHLSVKWMRGERPVPMMPSERSLQLIVSFAGCLAAARRPIRELVPNVRIFKKVSLIVVSHLLYSFKSL